MSENGVDTSAAARPAARSPAQEDRETALSERRERNLKERLGLAAGVLTIYLALVAAFFYWETVKDWTVDSTGDWALLIIGATLLAIIFYVGMRVVISSISIKRDVIPEADRELLTPLIASANEKAINQYVKLSSLAGATGIATRLGLTGLPLLTVALTLVFSALAIYQPNGEFMDLAKLTLGAFIGSFVQRAASEQSTAGSKKESPE